MGIMAYFSAALMAAIATAWKGFGLPRADDAFSMAVSPGSFEPAAFGFMLVIGLLLVSCTPRPSLFKRWVMAFHRIAFTMFSGVAGSMRAGLL